MFRLCVPSILQFSSHEREQSFGGAGDNAYIHYIQPTLLPLPPAPASPTRMHTKRTTQETVKCSISCTSCSTIPRLTLRTAVCLYLYLLHTSALTFNRGYELFRPSPCTSFALQHRAEKVQHHQIHPLAVRCVFSCLDHQAFHLPSCLPAFLPSCLIARARAGGTLSAASNSRTRAMYICRCAVRT